MSGLEFRWPRGFLGAVSLTFDDGLPSHLSLAAPMLEEYGFRGTFYLCPRGEGWREELKRWRVLADKGHEIGNHTVTHPCSCNFTGDPEARCLENMSLEEVRADILEAHRRIREVIPGGSRSFAYPCYETSVGRGRSRVTYIPVVAEIFLAARHVAPPSLRSNSPLACDLHLLWSLPADRLSCDEMVGLTVRALAEGRWAVFTFHGVNEGHLPVSDYSLRMLLEFLASKRGKVWVAPLAEVAEYVVEERRRLGLKV